MSKMRLYHKPMITAIVFLVLGLVMAFGGGILAQIDGNSDYYALVAFGALFFISAMVIFAIYGGLERKFQRVVQNDVLLNFTIDDLSVFKTAKSAAEDIRMNNNTALYIMLFFCVLFGLIFPFILEDGYIVTYICIGLGVFLTIAKIIITRYRTHKLYKGSGVVILSKGGAYVLGEFHCWNVVGSMLTKVKYVPGSDESMGHIKIQYQALTVPGPTKYAVTVPVPKEMEWKVQEIIDVLSPNLSQPK